MSCTTILVGKDATYDGSTFIARNDDSSFWTFHAKKFVVVQPKDQPVKYISVLSHVKITLPRIHSAIRQCQMPLKEKARAASGANQSNVAMTATETITSNERVLGADPLVEYVVATATEPEKIGGIGEEDLVVITAVHSLHAKVLFVLENCLSNTAPTK